MYKDDLDQKIITGEGRVPDGINTSLTYMRIRRTYV